MPHHLRQPVDIIHVIGALAAGGAERFVVDLLIKLKALGLNVGLLTLSSRQDPAGAGMRQLLETENIPFAQGPTDKVRLRSLIWYFRQLRSINPDIVHLHTENTELAYYLASKVYKSKHTVFRTIHSTNIRATFLNLLAVKGNQARVSISCSDAVRAEFRGKLQGEITTIQNGVNFDWPIQNDRLKLEYKKKLLLPHECYHFVQVGRQTGESPEKSEKAIDILIRAWKTSPVRRRGALLHLLGDGNLRNQLEIIADKDKSIIFHGIKDNIHDWLLAADCFVMPSRHEGLPIAGIEAVGTGIPCIFSDIPPLRELGSEAALWSEVSDIEQLARNLDTAMSLDAKIPVEATELVRKRFGIEKTAKRYRQCYLDAQQL